MDCNHIQKYFSEYIDDRLAENVKGVVESHLEACPACREELAALKKMVGHIRNLPENKAPENFVSQLDERLEPASGLKAILPYLKVPFRFKIPFGFATATAVAAVLIFMIHMEQPQKSMTRFTTEKPAMEKLEDGTVMEWELRLNISPYRGLDEKRMYKAKAARPRPLTGMSADDLSVAKEESRTRAGSEGLLTDEDDEPSATTMDQVLDDVTAVTKNLGGIVVSSEKTRSPDPEYVIILTIPAKKVKALYTELGRMGRFSLQPEAPPEIPEDTVTIHLKLTSL